MIYSMRDEMSYLIHKKLFTSGFQGGWKVNNFSLQASWIIQCTLHMTAKAIHFLMMHKHMNVVAILIHLLVCSSVIQLNKKDVKI